LGSRLVEIEGGDGERLGVERRTMSQKFLLLMMKKRIETGRS
jgi:hypothetical protein